MTERTLDPKTLLFPFHKNSVAFDSGDENEMSVDRFRV